MCLFFGDVVALLLNLLLLFPLKHNARVDNYVIVLWVLIDPVYCLDFDGDSSTQDNRKLGSVWDLVVYVLHTPKLSESSMEH